MTEANPNTRLEAFCDGVFAIAMTLLVIDLKIPATAHVEDTAGVWLALRQMAPAVCAFLLSFTVIFITWVNHHATLKLVDKSSSSFTYANGMLLLSVVVIPFPTALLGEYVLTDHAAPAVTLYNAVLALQAVAWLLLSNTVLENGLTRNDAGEAHIRVSRRYGVSALALYSACAVAALWFPLTVAAITVLIWGFWLTVGVRMGPA